MGVFDHKLWKAAKAQLPATIGTASHFSIGDELANYAKSAPASVAWVGSTYAVYVPFLLGAPTIVSEIAVRNGATVSGNIDVGISNENLTRLVSRGSTAQSGTNTIQRFDVTDTYLAPGLYYMVVSMDNTTGTLFMWDLGSQHNARMCGLIMDALVGAPPTIPATPGSASVYLSQYVPAVAISRFSGRFA